MVLPRLKITQQRSLADAHFSGADFHDGIKIATAIGRDQPAVVVWEQIEKQPDVFGQFDMERSAVAFAGQYNRLDPLIMFLVPDCFGIAFPDDYDAWPHPSPM
ncbi:hypothetical protein DBR17_04660 [Sphingomonas sp. HMWF008]|nr:hypothetical protein DBR17_04660 [Sphingomonas sp. HMWF008]